MHCLENYLIKIELITGTSIIYGEFVCVKDKQVVLRNGYYLNDKDIVLPTMSLSLSDLKYVEVLDEGMKKEYQDIIERKGLKTVYVAECENCMSSKGSSTDFKKKEAEVVNLEKLISTLDLNKSDDSLNPRLDDTDKSKSEHVKNESTDYISKHVTHMNESLKDTSNGKVQQSDLKLSSEGSKPKHLDTNLKKDTLNEKEEFLAVLLPKKEVKSEVVNKTENIVGSVQPPKDVKRIIEEKRFRNEKEINWRHKDSNERKGSEVHFSKSYQDGGDRKYSNKDKNRSVSKREHASFKNKVMTNSSAEENENMQRKNIVYGWKVKKYKDGHALFEAVKSKFTYNFDTNLSWGLKDGNSCYETGKSLYLNTLRRNRNNQKY